MGKVTCAIGRIFYLRGNMDLSTIEISTEYDNDRLSALSMRWKGESPFVEFSQELLRDNAINSLEKFYPGSNFQFGPYQLRLVFINNSRDVVLFKLINQEKLQGTYVGSIENEWNWQLKEKE